MTVPGCKTACPLNQFIKLTKDVIPKNWDLECLNEFDEKLVLGVATFMGM